MGPLDDRTMEDLDDECLFPSEMDAQKTQSVDPNQHISVSGSLPFGGNKMTRNGVYKSIKTVVFSNKLNLLMPFGPLAILVHKMTDSNVSFSFDALFFFPWFSSWHKLFKWWGGLQGWVFFLSLLGITPLAERLGYATE